MARQDHSQAPTFVYLDPFTVFKQMNEGKEYWDLVKRKKKTPARKRTSSKKKVLRKKR